jgi:hypothetical protein
METERKIQIETVDDETQQTIATKIQVQDKFETEDGKQGFNIVKKDGKMFIDRQMSNNELSLFSDQRWESAKQNMSKEDLEHYQNIGKQFHESINYTTGENTGVPIPQPISESIAYIEMGLRSGLSPEDLDENEIKVMEEYLGSNWADKYA